MTLFFLSSAGTSPAAEELLTIPEMAVTTRIVKRNPIDSVRRISASSEKTLYCFTRVNAPDDEERRISHIWYRNGETVAEYELPVRGSRWRTFSKKVIEKGMRGAWRVEAVDEEGNLLKAVEFTMN
ncbi:MAG: DUF2914 domain-containing protein [Geobacteraceae bacterium]|nr:DUF2914 domain-containing protein [Geobacteraceae bacterium]